MRRWKKMSRHTTTINNILNSFVDDTQLNLSPIDLIDLTYSSFFNFKFEWYCEDENTKIHFMKNFLMRYLNQYIGFETLGMFKSYLIADLSINMPLYKKIYEAQKEGDSPFISIERWYTNEEDEGVENKSNSKENVSGISKNNSKVDSQSIDSDNPQVTIANNDYASAMNRGESKTTSNNEVNQVNNKNNISASKRDKKSNSHELGFSGQSKSEALYNYTKQVIDINKMIIESERKLFLSVW